MPDVLFTQYRNELARVLGTCQHSSKVVSSKSVSVSSEGAESEEEEKAVSKSQHKWDKNISAQSSQIKDLCLKLDGQLLRTCRFGNCLIQPHCKLHSLMPCRPLNIRPHGKFFGKKHDPVVAAGKDGTTDPDKTCNSCKDMGHSIDNWLCLQKHQAFLEQQARSWEGLN